MGGDKRSRHQGATQLLEHQGGVGQPQSQPAGIFAQAQVEHSGITQLAPTVPFNHPIGSFGLAQGVESETPLTKATDPGGQIGLELGELKLHGWASLGSPRIRSPTMFRCICDVPAAMVSDIPRNQSSTMASAGNDPKPSRPSESWAANPARPNRDNEKSPNFCRVSV